MAPQHDIVIMTTLATATDHSGSPPDAADATTTCEHRPVGAEDQDLPVKLSRAWSGRCRRSWTVDMGGHDVNFVPLPTHDLRCLVG